MPHQANMSPDSSPPIAGKSLGLLHIRSTLRHIILSEWKLARLFNVMQHQANISPIRLRQLRSNL